MSGEQEQPAVVVERDPSLAPLPESPPTQSGQLETTSESKLNRKREREVSLEPHLSQDTVHTVDAVAKDMGAPAKKNRLQTIEHADEDDRSRSPPPRAKSPSLSMSPGNSDATRIRQIRERVKELNWRDVRTEEADQDQTMHEGQAPEETTSTPNEDVQADQKMEAAEKPAPVEAQDSTMTDRPPPTEPPAPNPETKSDEPPPSGPAVPIIVESTDPPLPAEHSKSPEPEDDQEKSLKRKVITRAASAELNGSEAHKRLRDESSEGVKKSPSQETPKAKNTGFLAFASTTSPFASFKSAKPVFGEYKRTSSTIFSSSTASSQSDSTSDNTRKSPPPTASPIGPVRSATPPPRSKPMPVFGASSGFGVSPVGSPPRKKTSRPVQAFGSYSSSSARFAPSTKPQQTAESRTASSSSSESAPKRQKNGRQSGSDEESPNEKGKQATFGEILRAGVDDEGEEDTANKMQITELTDVHTGEEEDRTVHQVRAKLYEFEQGQWKERGIGLLKLNVRRDGSAPARIVMRADGVLRLLLNVALFQKMYCDVGQDPKWAKFSTIQDGKIIQYAVRVNNAKLARELVDQIQSHLPGEV